MHGYNLKKFKWQKASNYKGYRPKISRFRGVKSAMNPSSENPPKNDVAFKKAVALGKEMLKKGDVTKADVARKMFELIKDEPREVVVQAFIDGAALTPKGASTYYYNVKRKFGRG